MKSNTDDDDIFTTSNSNTSINLDERIQQKADQLSSSNENQPYTELTNSNGQIGNYSGINHNHDNSTPISGNNSNTTGSFQSRNALLLNQPHRISQHEKQQIQKRKLFTFHNNEGDIDGSNSSSSFNCFPSSSSSSSSSFYHVMDESNFDSSATLNVELLVSKIKEDEQKSFINQKEGKKNNGDDNHDDYDNHEILIQPVRNQLQIHCYLPPKSNNLSATATGTNTMHSSKNQMHSIFNQQRLFGSFMGNTGFMHQRGWSNTQLLIGYYMFYGKSVLVDWRTENGLSKVRSSICFFDANEIIGMYNLIAYYMILSMHL